MWTASRLPTAGIGTATAKLAPRCREMADDLRSGGKTTLMMASDSPSRSAKARPAPARATMSTTAFGAAAASTPNTTVPSSPAVYIRFMPYLSPRAPAPSTAAAKVSVASPAMKLVLPADRCRPARTSEMFADRITGSAAVMLAPSPVARIVMVARVPDTQSGCGISPRSR